MVDLEDAYEHYLDAQHFESEYKVQASRYRRNRREMRELKKTRKEIKA